MIRDPDIDDLNRHGAQLDNSDKFSDNAFVR